MTGFGYIKNLGFCIELTSVNTTEAIFIKPFSLNDPETYVVIDYTKNETYEKKEIEPEQLDEIDRKVIFNTNL